VAVATLGDRSSPRAQAHCLKFRTTVFGLFCKCYSIEVFQVIPTGDPVVLSSPTFSESVTLLPEVTLNSKKSELPFRCILHVYCISYIYRKSQKIVIRTAI
jgi:hypothetical protein